MDKVTETIACSRMEVEMKFGNRVLADGDGDGVDDGRACGLAELRRRELGPANRANTRQRDLDLGVIVYPDSGSPPRVYRHGPIVPKKKKICMRNTRKKVTATTNGTSNTHFTLFV